MLVSGGNALKLATLHGTFTLPSDLPLPPQDVVYLSIIYQRVGWTLLRDVYIDLIRSGCGGTACAQRA